MISALVKTASRRKLDCETGRNEAGEGVAVGAPAFHGPKCGRLSPPGTGWAVLESLLLWATGTAIAIPASGAVDIWLPRQHVPAFVQPGSNFIAEVRGASNLPTGGWSASISNELGAWTCSVSSATYGTIHQGKENGWRLPIAVPTNAPPELFTLTVSNSNGGATSRVRAVRVVQTLNEDFYILQLTDQHVTAADATLANGNHRSGNGSTDALRWSAPVIDLINPRFLLITGDNNQLYNSATDMCGTGGLTEATNRVRLYYGALQQFSVPSVIVDGNHDIGYSSYTNSVVWRAGYEDLVGQRVFSLRMGSFYLLGNEFTYDDYLTWAKTDYNAACADPSVKYRLIAQHYPASWVQVAYSTNPCNLMLVGHSHLTQTYQTTPYPIQVSGTSQDHQKASFYSFKYNTGKWSCAQATNHAEGLNVWRLFGDWGSNAAVAATFTRTNNGTQSSNTASIVNTLPQDFYHGRVKFLMAHGTYTASSGTIESQYDYNKGTSTAVLVKMNIRSNATTVVSVVQTNPPAPHTNSAWLNFNGTGAGWIAGGSARIAGNVLSLTDPDNGGGDGSFFCQYPRYVGAFKAAFTYQAGGNKAADGVTFCIQNDPRGAAACGGNGGRLGVGLTTPITPSIELELNLYIGGGSTRGYAVLTNGLTGAGGANGGYHPLGSVNLDSGNPVDITICYADGQMALTFTDAVAKTSFRTNLSLGNLPAIVDGTTAYVGFTGAYGASTSVQTISNFSFVSLPKLAIQLSGASAPIAWPGDIAGYELQQNPDLTTGKWAAVTNRDNLTDGGHQVIVPVGNSNRFYRLISQP